jgi:hypothetical protein
MQFDGSRLAAIIGWEIWSGGLRRSTQQLGHLLSWGMPVELPWFEAYARHKMVSTTTLPAIVRRGLEALGGVTSSRGLI